MAESSRKNKSQNTFQTVKAAYGAWAMVMVYLSVLKGELHHDSQSIVGWN
jgi:hypothetical protein